jgi:hypothetical protein
MLSQSESDSRLHGVSFGKLHHPASRRPHTACSNRQAQALVTKPSQQHCCPYQHLGCCWLQPELHTGSQSTPGSHKHGCAASILLPPLYACKYACITPATVAFTRQHNQRSWQPKHGSGALAVASTYVMKQWYNKAKY